MNHRTKTSDKRPQRKNLAQAIRELFFGGTAGRTGRGTGQGERYRGRSLQIHPSLETLEGRALMAVVADVGSDAAATLPANTATPSTVQVAMAHGPRHNDADAEDVDNDGSCTATDVLSVINTINANSASSTASFVDVDGDGACTASDVIRVINRINSGNTQRPKPTPSTPTSPVAAGEVRSMDGTGNNVTNTTWGSVGVDLLRTAPAEYGDGVSSVAGAGRPSAREISNSLSDQEGASLLNAQKLSAMSYAWGQFIDHDLDLTPTGGTDVLKIAVPTGDPSFDPLSTGTQGIYTSRSIFDAATGTSTSNPRQQVNTISAFLDGSMVYGSDATTAKTLRTLSGGLMKTSEGNLLPLNDVATLGAGNTLGMANDAHIVSSDKLFAAGDVRANENVELTSLQTLFVREHNYWAAKIAAGDATLTDEQIYQKARAIVIGEIESITYNQWLPAILGRSVAPYKGYNASVNPGIANEFSTAAFRFGHSLLGDDIEFLDNDGNEVVDEIPLAAAFFNPDVVKETGIDPLLKYLSSDTAQELDTKVVESVRNFLFGPPGAGGLDLASLNIERGRDHGLADYNATRVAYHLPAVTSFAQITSDTALQAKLKDLYGTVDNIDLWVGGLAEDHVAGGNLGPTFTAIIADQFQRLRDGDRFWYEGVFTGQQLNQIRNTTLADVIQRNTDVTGLQNNVFYFKVAAEGQVYVDLNADGKQNGRGEVGLGGVEVQLLDEEGAVLATTKTGRDGKYRFDRFGGTGDYSVQVILPTNAKLTTEGSLDLHLSAGGQVAGGLNFGLSLTGTTTPTPKPPKPAPPPTHPKPRLAAADGQAAWSAAVDSVFGG